jgi:hypothetical protein
LLKVTTEIKQLELANANLNKENIQYSSAMIKLEKDLKILRTNKCPHCEQSYSKAADEIDQVSENLAILVDTSAKHAKEQSINADCIHQLKQARSAVQSQLKVENMDELLKIHANKHSIISQIEELTKQENPHIEMLEELSNTVLDPVDYSVIDVMQKTQDMQNFLLKLLTKNDSFVRKSLLNKFIPFLNARLLYHLQSLAMPHVVEFQEDLSAKISLNNIEIKFGNLSTGQRARIDFAFALAFKDVREKLHGKANICIFDEVLDYGLDAVGVVACAKAIKHLARTSGASMYIISHRNEIDSAFDHKLTVQMDKGFSQLVDNN